MLVLCAGCNNPILDKFLLTVLDRTWHSTCVLCSECQCSLTDKCFARDGKLFCKEDFFRRFGTKCGGCNEGIAPSDLVRRARDRVYHVTCFTCMICGRQLSTGDQLYILDDNQFICKNDFCSAKLTGLKIEDAYSDKEASLQDEGSRDSTQLPANIVTNHHSADSTPLSSTGSGLVSSSGLHHPGNWGYGKNKDSGSAVEVPRHDSTPSPSPIVKQEHLVNTDSNCSVDSNLSDASSNPSTNNNCYKEMDKENSGSRSKEVADNPVTGTKRRGPRTTIKAKQLETLKSAFAATPKPTRHIREQLAQETGLNMRVIQVWFQNRRSKERRMKQLSAMGARRQFYRNPRRMRAMRPGDHDFLEGPDILGHPGMGFFTDSCDFYPGYPGYDFFPLSAGNNPASSMSFPLPPLPSGPPQQLVDQVSGQIHDGHVFLSGDGMRGGEVIDHQMQQQQHLPSRSPSTDRLDGHPSYENNLDVGHRTSMLLSADLYLQQQQQQQQQQQHLQQLGVATVDSWCR